ncbi:MAG TPA: VWA domain-containing protein [Gemmatimonadaceae bacterium]
MSAATLDAGALGFARPWALAALVVLVAGVAVLLARAARLRRRDLARFGDPALLERAAPLPSPAARAARATLRLAALALLALALARPRWGMAAGAERHTRGDVFFLLDLSRSMLAEDAPPSRLAAAKRAASAIARALPDARVGLLVFGGSGFLQLPPTADHSTFARFLEAASPSDFPDPATNLEAAADLAAAAAAREGDTTGVALVLLSDGEDVEGKLMKAVGAFRSSRIRVSVVGVGTPEGSTIPDRDASGAIAPHRDWAGRVVVTHLVESNLRDIARLTGGVYARWGGSDAVLAPVVSAVRAVPSRSRESRASEPIAERFQWPLALALLALVVEGALPSTARRRGGKR